jgi:hypothetical protein
VEELQQTTGLFDLNSESTFIGYADFAANYFCARTIVSLSEAKSLVHESRVMQSRFKGVVSQLTTPEWM